MDEISQNVSDESLTRSQFPDVFEPQIIEENENSNVSRLQRVGDFLGKKMELLCSHTDVVFEDLKTDPVKNSIAAGVLLTTQFLDRTREPFVQLSRAATSHVNQGSPYFFEGLGNSTTAGMLAGGILAGSYVIIGEGVSAGLRAFPKTTARFIEKYPRFYKVAKHSTAGITPTGDRYEGQPSRNLFQKVKSALNLGVQGLALGTAAQAAVSTVEGWDRKESSKLIAKTSAVMGALTVPIVIGVDAVVDKLILNRKYSAAENMVDIVSSRTAWLGLAALSVVLNYRRNSRIANASDLQ